MSYPYNQGSPQQGYNPQGQYPGGPPPGQGYGAPPMHPGQQQPWGQQPPPQQQQQWNAPPQQGGHYPPPQQGGQYSPPGQYPPQPQGHAYSQQPAYGQPPPPSQYGQHPPSQYGQPPYQGGAPHQQGYPPSQHHQPYGAPMPSQGYGQPPFQQPGAYVQPSAPPAPPSPGYVIGQRVNYDARRDVEAIRRACKGFGTDEKALIAALVRLDPLQLEAVNMQYTQETGKPLISLIESETSGDFGNALTMICRGPLQLDVWLLNKALKGFGTKEIYLNDVLLGRRNADIEAIKVAYQREFHVPLLDAVKSDLSGKTERMFEMVLAARRTEESAQPNPATIQHDVIILHNATEGRIGTDEIEVCRILTTRNDNELRAIAMEFEKMYQISLEKVIIKEFTGDMEEALLYLLQGATNKAKRDAMLIGETMKGMGTKEEELSQRLVRAHWTPGYMAAVKREYALVNRGKDMINDVKGETKGDFERVLVALAA